MQLVIRLVAAMALILIMADKIIPQVLQRIYKYGGQPVVRDYLAIHYGQNFEQAFGKKTGKAILHSTAGR
jgi:hypothetical protein